jgi:aerobic-type carbon monoxide dehydrogenase small subunit (CoxS/CutS family)
MESEQPVEIEVNGQRSRATVPVRTSLADFLREHLGLTGTHVGCEQGVCGACTVLLDGRSVRSCIVLAAAADGRQVRTVESLADGDGLHPLQEAFRQHHGLQCGFCTPGFLMTLVEVLGERRGLDDDEIRDAISGNVCRCTGYQGIVEAVRTADRTWDRSVEGEPE